MKSSFKVLLPLLLLSALPAAVEAQFTFTTNNGAITITGYDCPGTEVAVTIPSTISDLPVTSIAIEAFYDCTSLSGVTIPNSVTNIGEGSFQDCTSLTNVVIGTNITSIGEGAFYECTRLTSVTIPSSVISIGDGAFQDCTSLTNVTIGTNVTSIGEDAFYECTHLTSATIPNSVTIIGQGTFEDCFSLINVTIGNSVTSIGGDAFYGCTGLTSVTMGSSVSSILIGAFSGCTKLTSVAIPNSVTFIGEEAFEECTSLTAITVGALNTVYSSVAGVLFNKTQTTLVTYPEGKAGTYTIPNSVTYIGGQAFDYCPGLTSVTIGNNVTNIGDYAFASCTSLNGVYFLGNAPSVDSSVFAYDSNVTVYCLPGTTGWATGLGNLFWTNTGLTPVLWQPQVQMNDGGFGVRTNQFGFNIAWASGMVIVVEATTDLANPAWSPVSTNTLTGGSSYFSDPQWTDYPARFYRLRSP